MRDDEPASGDAHAAAAGFLHCLQMLADEAERRSLFRTRIALRKAIRACQAEEMPDRSAPRPRSRRSMAMH